MGDFTLANIKEILRSTSSEIQVVQKELSRSSQISNQKVEKLKELLSKSEGALKKLKEVQAIPSIESSNVQTLIENILKAKAVQGGQFNPAVLQAILSSLQTLNNDLNEVTLKEGDHKRGQKVEGVNYEKL